MSGKYYSLIYGIISGNMKTTIVDAKGKIEEKNLNRKDFVDLLNLNVRDLRPVFSVLQVSTILPRSRAVIINLGFIKAVLTADKSFFLHQHQSETLENFLKSFEERISSREKIDDFFLFALEQILEAKARQMNKKVATLDESLRKVLHDIQRNFSGNNLEKMLYLKKRVSKLETRLKEIHSAAKEVLEDEQNFFELVSVSAGENNARLEIESILENFIEQIEDNIGHIFRAKEDLDDTDQYINLKLSSQRTTVVQIDLVATLFALIFSFLAVIVGLYGVNLKNGYENSSWAFYILSLILIIIFIISSVLFVTFLKRKKII